MSTAYTVAILGAGRLGSAVAHTMCKNAAALRIWSRRPEQARLVAEAIGPRVRVASSVKAAVVGADVTVLAVPLAALRSVAKRMGPVVQGDHVVLHAVRGVERGFVLPHAVLREETCVRRIGVLGGPIYAPQLAGAKIIAAVLAARFWEPWEVAQALVAGSAMRLHRSADLIGVQVAGAVSNATAVVVGIAQALKLGDTAHGMLLTRGLMEAASLTQLCGGDAQTLVGLAGVGDLVPRHVATASRHMAAGRDCVRGDIPSGAALQLLDGLHTARAAVELADKHAVDLPLMQAVEDIVTGRRLPEAACEEVLALDFSPGEVFAPHLPAGLTRMHREGRFI